MTDRNIKITQADMEKLAGLVDAASLNRGMNHEHLADLEEELDRAEIVTGTVPPNVVTMNAYVRVTDLETGREYEYQLVFPRDADLELARISVLAPIGTALLGYSVGSEIEWNVPGGRRRLRIDKVVHEKDSLSSSVA